MLQKTYIKITHHQPCSTMSGRMCSHVIGANELITFASRMKCLKLGSWSWNYLMCGDWISWTPFHPPMGTFTFWWRLII